MDVADYLRVAQRRWKALLAGLLVGVVAAVAMTAAAPDTYVSSTCLFVNVPAATGLNEALQGVKLTSGLLESYAAVATSRMAAERIIEATHSTLSPGRLSSKLSAVPQADTLLITISARDHEPEVARDLSLAAANVFVDIVDEFETGRDEKIEAARIIDRPTVPSSPTSPKRQRNLAVGLLGGIALAFGAAFVLEALDRTIHTPQQVANVTGRSLLAVVPNRKESNELVLADSTDPAGEAYRSLRTSIQFLGTDRLARSILVTSPSPGDGKTTLAANLAIALSQSGARVILVDADLRRGRLGALFGAGTGPGVTSVLAGEIRAAEALHAWSPTLSVLATGPLPPNPAELAGSQAMAELLTELEELADIVIADAPPIMAVTDVVALATQVEATVLVVRVGRTRRDHTHEASRRLEAVGAGVIGCVVNAVPGAAAMPYHDYTPKPAALAQPPRRRVKEDA